MGGSRDPLVGRADELARLGALVGTGAPAAVVVTGPSGIGKSRLVEELAAVARAEGRPVGVGRAWPGGDGPAGWPWREVFDALSLDGGMLAPDGDRAERFASALAALARRPDALVVLEDLHAADEETLLLARLAMRAAGAWRGAVVATWRPEPSGSVPIDDLRSAIERDAEVVVLDALDAAAVAELLRAVDPEATDDLAALVHRFTEGNPLHLRTLVAGAKGRAGWLAGPLEERIEGQVAELPPELRAVVEAAAVVGGSAATSELAAAADRPPAAVEDDAERLAKTGLVVLRAGGVEVAHDLIRRVVLAGMAAGSRAEVHARLAAHLASGPLEDRARSARHGLAAAELGVGVVAGAVLAARGAAADLRRASSPTAASALLDRAVEVARGTGATVPASLLVEAADATLACGRLLDARPRFEAAAAEAARQGDPVARARAALGLGGVWLGEHRDAGTAARVLGIQREALAALPEAEAGLRARLALRIRCEEAYRRAERPPLEQVLAGVRAEGDPEAVIEGLSLLHHAMLQPGSEAERLALADEQLALATAHGDELRALVALAWRAIDLFLLGDPNAGRALADLSRRADAVRCQAVVYLARVMEAMLLIRAGRFEEGEAAASAALDVGTEVGDADALGYFAVQLFAIRMWQGRDDEVLDVFGTLVRSPDHLDAERSAIAAVSLLAARADRPEQAAAFLDEALAGGLGAIPRSSTWLACLAAAAEAAVLIGRLDVAEEVAGLLAPFADLPVMPSFAVVCFGPVHRPLGLVAEALGDLAAAEDHLRAAVERSRQIGNVPVRLRSQAELGRVLTARGDAVAGQRALADAVREARDLGLDGLVAGWRADADRVVGGAGVTAEQGDDGRWTFRLGEDEVVLPDLVGCRYLALLLANPGQEVPVLRLAMGTDAVGARQEVVDGHAMAQLRRRVDELRAEIDDAEEAGRAEAAEAAREELDAIAQHLASSLGLGGRVRSFDDLPERARTSVQKAVRRVIDRIDAAQPLVGGHLRTSVRTGLRCSYAPPGPTAATPQ